MIYSLDTFSFAERALVNLLPANSLFRGKYPSQFWVLVIGNLISTIGTSMVWPFLIIYVKEKLGLGLTAAAALMTVNSVVGLFSAFLAGPIVDRLGRKWVMVVGLAAHGLIYLSYPMANTYAFTALLMGLTGFITPLFRVGSDAMLADLVPPARRADAYALMRMAHNAGISIGPAIGGFVAAVSYNNAFLGAAVGLGMYAVLMTVSARETLPGRVALPGSTPASAAAAAVAPAGEENPKHESISQLITGYLRIFLDKPFMSFIIAFTLNQVSTATIWVLLAEHAKHNYGVIESLYGFIPMTNALMVVLLQSAVTARTRDRRPLPVMALGSLFYGVAAASVALGSGFWGFWISMVVMTIGELMLMPIATTFAANLAPAHMRGRYMSIFGLTWSAAMGTGPLLGGYLRDTVSLASPWLMAGISGFIAALLFVWMSKSANPFRKLL